MTGTGTVQTNVQTLKEDSLFLDDEKTEPITPPKPFVQSLSPSGELKIGFTSPMKVVKDLDALNEKKVALRWD
jgi:hypothetical protein